MSHSWGRELRDYLEMKIGAVTAEFVARRLGNASLEVVANHGLRHPPIAASALTCTLIESARPSDHRASA